MQCRACQQPIESGSRFCPSCGAPQAPSCAGCGAELGEAARFCAQCGAPRTGDAVASTPAPSGERRQLSVMFCDLVGSSALAQRLDPEEFSECVRAYQRVCAKTIEGYDGYVAQYLGDGVLAYFGFPQAHEEDAERAVRGGLELLQALRSLGRELEPRLGARLQARVGIHTGPVVVDEMGAGGRRETLALGDTTNIAARLEGLAEPDSLVISEATLRLVSGLFLTRSLGTPDLKGISERIQAFAVEGSSGVRSRLELASRLTPIVGRGAELGSLREAWDQARAGHARAVAIRGEAGLGKSRLVALLRQELAEAPHTWLELRCSPFSTGSALQPVTELLGRFFGLREGEAGEASTERLRRGIEELGVESPQEMSERFARLLALPLAEDSPPQEAAELARHRSMEMLVAFVLALGRRQPVVLLCEDLHWSDPSTQQWIRLLLERAETAPLLCLLTHRPEFALPWSSPAVDALALSRLSAEEARALARAALLEEVLPPPVLDSIVERADGVPLFIEELVKMVAEARGGESELEVPATLRDSLMARLDRLGTAKQVAQIGAVLGRDFAHSLLQAVAGEDEASLQRRLDRLLDAGLIFRSGTAPDCVYTFKHALVQDTAYASLLNRRRRELHGAVAGVLEERVGQGAEVAPALLAHHWRGAEQWLRAAQCFDTAGRRAAALAACDEAIGLYREGLAMAEHAAEGEERKRRELSLTIMLGNAIMASRGFAAPELLPVWQRGCELAEAVDDPTELSSARNGAAVYHLTNGDCEQAERYAKQVLELAPRADARIVELRGNTTLSQVCYLRGEGERALALAERALGLYRPSDFWEVTYGSTLDTGVAAYGAAALAQTWLGRLDDGLASARSGVELAQELDSPVSLAAGLTFVCIQHIERGEPEALLEVTAELMSLATQLSFPVWLGFAKLAAGFVHAWQGRSEGLEEMLAGVALQDETVGRNGAALGVALLAEAHLRLGLLDTAEGMIQAGLALGRELHQPYYAPQLRILDAELLLARDPEATASVEQGLREAWEEARRMGARLFELRAATRLARLQMGAGRHAEARALLEQSRAGFQGSATRDDREARGLLEALA